MALIQDNRSFASLIQMTGVGLNIADYPTIKKAIVEKYKEIYGSDIDLNNTTADGVFIETLTLMIFNILQNVKFLYSNLDIRTASGKFLEALSALSGVYRNPATKSQAQLEITNLDTVDKEINAANPLRFVDLNGLTWTTDVGAGNTIVLKPNVASLVDVYCDQVGPISAPAGWITKLVDNSITLNINQPNAAVEGEFSETDSELRSRRNEVISSQGVTVLANLIGALLNITGVEDTIIYNNDSNSAITALDETSISGKSIYVVLRKNSQVQIDDSIIGSRIYEKLTPGINTNQFTGQTNTGTSKHYNYVQSTTLGEGTGNIDIYWKECTPINKNLDIIISFKPGSFFATNDDETTKIMANTIVDYLNNLKINEKFTTYDMVQIINDEDPMFNNLKTYNVIDVKFNYDTTKGGTTPIISTLESGNLYEYQTKDTYFEIKDYQMVEDSSTSTYTLTLTING